MSDRCYSTDLSATDGVLTAEQQALYRDFRQKEELRAYRRLVRTIVMHQPPLPATDQQQQQQTAAAVEFSQLSRAQQRLLEDLEAELHIPVDLRRAVLLQASMNPRVNAVRASGVAGQRMLYFDGETADHVEGSEDSDDDDSVFADASDSEPDGASIGKKGKPGAKQNAGARRPRDGAAASGKQPGGKAPNNAAAAAAAAAASAPAAPAALKTVSAKDAEELNKLDKEVRAKAGELVKCHDPKRAVMLKADLQKCNLKLTALLKKLQPDVTVG